MAKKTAADLLPRKGKKLAKPTVKRADGSWAAAGWDTSMTAITIVAVGYDAILDKMIGPEWGETRFMPEDDYWYRLGMASRAHDLATNVLGKLWVPFDQVHMAFEEPWFYGAVKMGRSDHLKQQAEVAGATKGSLVKYGFSIRNMHEINNSQWRSMLKKEGVTIRKGPEGKWDVKDWAIKAFGLPVLPDLVKSKEGGKIPRPESGFGAKAKAVQPNDIYDAAAVCAWMCDNLPSSV